MLNPPGSLSAVVMPGPKVSLQWSDTSTGEDGFYIERSDKKGGGFKPFARIGVAIPNATGWTDSTPWRGKPSKYRVRSFAGNTQSAPSNEVQVRT